MSDTTAVAYYPYEEVTLDNGSTFNIYTGEVIPVEPGDDKPKNAVPWKPHPAAANFASYFDGHGWTMRQDVTKLTFSQLQGICNAKVQQTYETEMKTLSVGYTVTEQKSWEMQVAGATDVLAGKDSELLDALAEARGEDVHELAQKIVDKATAHNKAVIATLAKMNQARTAINAATEVKDLPVITIFDLGSLPASFPV